MIIDKILLFPYYLTLLIRNHLYDKGSIKSVSFDVPIICVGNITVGGTGKTPMVEMLVRMYMNDYRIAVISRGYKRKSRGYREVLRDDSYSDVGDEPIQIKRKFPEITVVVDSSRKKAIEHLLAQDEKSRPTLIILDDAFQHRKVVPSVSIVLVDSSRPTYHDHLIPFGKLRDLPSQIKRADIVVVTKVSEDITDEDRERWRSKLRLSESQSLFFSQIGYREPKPVFVEGNDNRYIYSKSAILFTGIANDSSIRNFIMGKYKLNEIMSFDDHHVFSSSEIRSIDACSKRYPTSVVFTTEKDAQRIVGHRAITSNLRSKLFYIPIKTEIIPKIEPSMRVFPEEMGDIGESQFKESIHFDNIKK